MMGVRRQTELSWIIGWFSEDYEKKIQSLGLLLVNQRVSVIEIPLTGRSVHTLTSPQSRQTCRAKISQLVSRLSTRATRLSLTPTSQQDIRVEQLMMYADVNLDLSRVCDCTKFPP